MQLKSYHKPSRDESKQEEHHDQDPDNYVLVLGTQEREADYTDTSTDQSWE